MGAMEQSKETTVAEQSGAYRTDDYGNVVFEESGDGDKCPVCHHAAEQHDALNGCSQQEDYDHLNGFHECGCPLRAAIAKGEDVPQDAWPSFDR
jgi:hypothetical protein